MKRAILFFLLVFASACASKTAPAPPAVTTPKYPDYIFPAAPAGVGTPAAIERHQAGWGWLQAGKAMPAILTKPEEIETWMTAPPEVALKLQRPLDDGNLKIVATGDRKDGEM